MTKEDLLSVADVAALLRVKASTVSRWCRAGRIPAFKLEHQWRFSQHAIDEWLQAKECSAHGTART